MIQGHGRSHGIRRYQRGCSKSGVRGLTKAHLAESIRRDDRTAPRGPFPARSFPDQRRRCQDTNSVQQRRVRAHGWWCKPRLQDPFVDANLFAKKTTLSPAVQMAHIKALVKSTVKYPMRSVDCKVYSSRMEPGRTRTRTCSSAPCRNDCCCAAPCTWTDDRYPTNHSSRISPTSVT